jgi:preprotein translocase SecE subunit
MANEKKGKSGEGAAKAANDRREDAPKGADSGVARAGTFVLVAKIWILLTGAFLGASAYYLAGGLDFFGKAITKAGPVTVNPGLILSVAVAVVSWFGVSRLFRGHLGWELPSQGKWVRTIGYVGVMVLMVFGAIQLHGYSRIDSIWSMKLASVGPFLGKSFDLRPILFPSVALVLVSGLVCHFLGSRPAWRGFMIETEAEMKKVSWPARTEWVGSSIVVLVVVSTMAIFLYLCDIGLSRVMNEINAGF